MYRNAPKVCVFSKECTFPLLQNALREHQRIYKFLIIIITSSVVIRCTRMTARLFELYTCCVHVAV